MSIHLDPETLGARQEPSFTPTITASPLDASESVPAATPKKAPKAWQRAGQLLAVSMKSVLFTGATLVVVFFLAERYGSPSWKPSSMIGAFGGNQYAAHVLTSIEAARATATVQAQEAERARQETIVIQAQNDRVTRAYEALFQRGNMLAQAWADSAKQTLIMSTEIKMQGLKGKMGVSNTKENLAMWCDLGSLFSPDITCGDNLRSSARNDRDMASNEIMENFKTQSAFIVQTYKAWAEGLPDPASVVAYKANFDRLYPVPAAPIPAPPIDKQGHGV